jgi:protein required for attachment to host cells
MSKVHIPHDGIVFVGDGRKALFLRNHGDDRYLDLKTERVFVDHNPPTREQGTDRPGRAFASIGPARSAIEPTDWHDLEEHRFARAVADALETFVREHNVKAIVIIAPPRALADLRRAFHESIKSCIVAEIDKELTNQPLDEIEKHLR